MRTFDVQAVCLKATPYDEAHQIVSFYTAEEGLVRAIAKGVKKPTSKLRGACEPLTLNRVSLIQGRNLHTVSHYDRIQSFPLLRGDLERMAAGSVGMDLLATLGREHDPDSQAMFDLVAAMLTDLDTSQLSWVQTSLVFQKTLLAMSGYEVDFETCIHCNHSLNLQERRYSVFVSTLGGFLCPACEAGHVQGVKVSTGTRHLLGSLNGEDTQDELALKAHRFLHYVWTQRLERPLPSFDFLFQLLAPVETFSVT